MEEYLLSEPKSSKETVLDFHPNVDKDLLKGLQSAIRNEEIIDLRNRHYSNTDSTTLLIEQEFWLNEVFTGFIDLVVLGEPNKVVIRDHKFTSAKRWIPSEEDLLKDPQTIIYSVAMANFFKVENVEFNFDYYGTKSKFYVNRKLNLTVHDLNAKWLDVVNDTLPLLDNYSKSEKSETQINFLACYQYGGCEFKQHCGG